MNQLTTEELLHQLQAVVDNSYDAIISSTLDGIITSWNGGAQRMFGYMASEVVGKSGSALFPPEMWVKVPALLQKIKEKEAVGDYDISGLRKDGTSFSMAISISPILKEDGTVVGASIVERDITARSRAWELVRQFEILVQSSHDAIIGETLDGIITSWNRGAEKMFGYSAEEVVGKSAVFLFPPKMKDLLPSLMGRVRAGEFIADYNGIRLRKDGTAVDVSVTLSPVIDVNGKVISASVVERDISERKKLVEIMRQTQSGVNNSQDGIVSSSLDGIILSWNKGAQVMLGYSAEEILGKSALLLFPPEKVGEFKLYSDKIKKNESITNYNSLALRKDGSKVDISISLSPILSEDGIVVGASVFFRDITEHNKMEQEVLEGVKKFEIYTQKAPLGIFVADSKGHYIDANPMACEMSGYTKGELLTISVKDFIAPDYLEEGMKLFTKVLGSGYSKSEIKVRRKNGENFWISLAATKIDENTIIAFCEDISERKRSEEKIKELNDVHNKFIDIISHQLRTPLTAVNWNLESILDGDFGKLEDSTRKFLKATHKSSMEITERIHYFLAAMYIEEGRMIFKKTEVNIDNIVAAVANEVAKECEAKDISFKYIAPAKDLPVINADGEKMRTAIKKMLENAVAYTKENGEIVATLQLAGDTIRFEVRDTGIGIPKSEQHRVFSRFFRGSNAAIMQTDAFGLGLFLAQHFVEQHHGKIGFESEEDKGSMFWFELPIAQK